MPSTAADVDSQRVVANKKATEALRAAIVGVFCVGFVLGPIAIVMGAGAARELKALGTPRGKAIAAQVIGAVATVGWLYKLWVTFSW